MLGRHGHKADSSLLPMRRIGVKDGDNKVPKPDPCKKDDKAMSGRPKDGKCDKKPENCCLYEKKAFLSVDEYDEWLKLYEENCKKGTVADPRRLRELSRRLHLWRDGFTSDSTYQRMRAKYFDRVKIMASFACFLSEFLGTFIYTFLPVLIIAAVPLGAYDAYGAFGPVAMAIGALVAATFTHLFMHGSYFEPTTTLLLFWFSDDFTVKKHRNFWPTLGRILGQLAAGFVGAALLLIFWHHGSERFERVAQIADYPNFWESANTDDDFAGPGHTYNVGQSLFAIVICSLIYNMATFAIHVISRSIIVGFTPYRVLVPILVGLAVLATVWGQWNITRGSSGIVKWLVTESVLVGHWAYGETDAMQSSAWIFPVGVLISHVAEILIILAFCWLYQFAGLIPEGFNKLRAAASTETDPCLSSDSESDPCSSSDSD